MTFNVAADGLENGAVSAKFHEVGRDFDHVPDTVKSVVGQVGVSTIKHFGAVGCKLAITFNIAGAYACDFSFKLSITTAVVEVCGVVKIDPIIGVAGDNFNVIFEPFAGDIGQFGKNLGTGKRLSNKRWNRDFHTPSCGASELV